MATETIKVLGQSSPSATTNTDIYTVPASTSTVISSIVICNRDSSAATFRIAIRPAGAAIANKHYIFYDNSIDANTTYIPTFGGTIATTDVVTVYASTTTLSFSLFGVEAV